MSKQSLESATSSTSCEVFHDFSSPTHGLCLTPSTLGGFAGTIQLDGQRRSGNGEVDNTPSRCGPGRLVALNSFEDKGHPERQGIVFDLQNPKPIGGNAALFCEEYPNTTWTSVSVDMSYLDVGLDLGERHWIVRMIFESNPITEEPEIASCGLDPHYIESQNYFAPTVHRGDILVCRNPPVDGKCQDTDFEFLDVSNNTFATSRPVQALQIPYMRMYREGFDEQGQAQDIWCRQCDDPHAPFCGYESGGYALSFSFEKSFKLYSEFVTSQDPRHPENVNEILRMNSKSATVADIPEADLAPVVWYTLENNMGDKTQGLGIKMDVVLRLSLEDFIFLNGIHTFAELNDLSDAELLQKIEIRDMYSKMTPQNYAHASLQKGEVNISFAP